MRKSRHAAFTLAEMMVVMLIMSIILAAMAPVMTTRNKIDNSSPWRYSPQNASNAYFGAGQAMHALIGQVEATENDNGKLVINTLGSTMSHILFKSNNDVLGGLYLSGSSIVLGNRRNDSLAIGNENINIGHENWSNALEGSSNITIGDNSMQALTTGSNNIGIGTTLNAVQSGSHNVAVGDNSLTATTGNGNIAIGGNANQTSNTHSTIAIGRNSSAQGLGAIAIGSNIENAEDSNPRFSANSANASGEKAIAIGPSATAENYFAIALGYDTHARSHDAIAIGATNSAQDSGSISIGRSSRARGEDAIAIGDGATSDDGGVAIKGEAKGGSVAINGTTVYGNSVAINGLANGGRFNTESVAINGSTAGAYSIAINSRAVGANTIAINGTVNGSDAIGIGGTADGMNAIAIRGTAGQGGIAIGSDAVASSLDSIAIGNSAIARGEATVAIGFEACSNVTGANKVCIGADSGPMASAPEASNGQEVLYLGSEAATVFIPGKLVVGGNVELATNTSSQVYMRTQGKIGSKKGFWLLDNFGGYIKEAGGANPTPSITLSSDRRLKYVGKENTAGLDKIRQLKIFNFTYKKDPTKEPHVGVIAQDLQKVFPNAVKKGADGFLTIRMEDMFYAVINAIKELDSRVTALEKENKELKTRLDKLEAKIK